MGLSRDDVQGKLNKRKVRLPAAMPSPRQQVRQATSQFRPPTATAFHGDPAKAIRRYKPAFPGEKPAGYEPLPQYGQFGRPLGLQQRPYYETQIDHRSPLEMAVDQDVTPILSQAPKIASSALTVPANIAGNALAQFGGGPAILSAASHLKHGELLPAAGAAATLFPFGRFGKAAKSVKEAVEAEEAAKTVSGADELRAVLTGKTAKNMGEYEKVGAKIDDPLFGASASKVRAEQDKLASIERAKRIHEAERLMNKVGGEEGHRLAMKALKGELPKLKLTGGQELSRDNIPALFEHIQQHPDLRPFEKVRTRNALLKVFDGTTPQPSEIKLLKQTFGLDADELVKSASLWQHSKGLAGELMNLPRALMSTLDMSALLRQNLVASITHPVLTAKNVEPMLNAFKSEAGYNALQDAIVSSPNYDKAKTAGLAITDFEGGLSAREEAWYGRNLAEKITGGQKYSPVAMSSRAYVGLLNKTRMDIFDHLVNNAGRDLTAPQLHDIAKAVNSATGRGTGPNAIKSWLPALNTLFFSPRLLFSRLDYLNPVNYTRLDPIARKEYLKGALGLAASVGTVLSLAKLAGAQVGVDPTNADFAKIKVGNTRIDLLGGFQQPIRLLAQLEQGKVTSSTTGETLTLGPQGPGKLSRFDIGLRFAEGKLAPVPGVVVDLAKQTDFQGNPLSAKSEVVSHLSPLALQDAYDLYRQSGPLAAAGSFGLSAIGVGIQTYGPQDNSYQSSLAAIDTAVKNRQLTPDEAATYKKQLERSHYLETHDTKDNRRQFIVDEMRQQGSDKADINQVLHQLHYDPLP